jgi:hypothetical protein
VRRPVLLGAAWTASAAAAVGLGFLAVSLVDASASPGTSPVAATSSTATQTGTAAPPSDAASPTATAMAMTAEHATIGGTVYANCTGGQPVLAGVPTAGWSVDDSADPGKVEFRSGTQKVEVTASCADGNPYFVDDDSNSGDDGTQSSSPASSAASPSTDDSTGRAGGGHGSDD